MLPWTPPESSQHNSDSGNRIIDVSEGTAEQLGFAEQGIARVHAETIQLKKMNADHTTTDSGQRADIHGLMS